MSIYKLQELSYANESSFAENATSPSSNTYSTKLPIISGRAFVPEQSRGTDGTLQSRMNVTRPGYLGVRTGFVEFSVYWCGYGSDPGAGTLSETWLQDLLSDWLGGGHTGDDGGTISSATDGDTFVTTGVTGMTAGSIMRVGTKGDGRCDGQAGAISTWSGGNTQLLNALPGTPNASDAVRPCQVAYPHESQAVVSKRFLMAFTASGAQWHAMGCVCESVRFELPIGGLPRLTFRYRVAYWDRSAVTTPSATAMSACDAAVIAGGSVFFNSFGTTTRAVLNPATISLDVAFTLINQEGPAAGHANYQVIRGYERGGAVPTLTMTIPWDTTYLTSFATDGSGSTYYHCLVSLNAQEGRAAGFYLPRAYLSGVVPSHTDQNGLLYQTVTLIGTESTDATSELTKSCFRLFNG